VVSGGDNAHAQLHAEVASCFLAATKNLKLLSIGINGKFLNNIVIFEETGAREYI
jgi:hypothetical protein